MRLRRSNGSSSSAHADFEGVDFEVVLVNDGSADSSEEACLLLVRKFPDTVR